MSIDLNVPMPVIGDVDTLEAQSFAEEYFSELLQPEDALLLARVCLALAAGAERLPDEFAVRLRERLDPAWPKAPLSFHLRRHHLRTWANTGVRPDDAVHTWVPEAGGFALVGLALHRPLPPAFWTAAWAELLAPDAASFWGLNLGLLAEDLAREEQARGTVARGVRAGAIAHLARTAREGRLGFAFASTLLHLRSWMFSDRHGLLAVLGEVDEELPDALEAPLEPPRGGGDTPVSGAVARAGTFAEVHEAYMLGEDGVARGEDDECPPVRVVRVELHGLVRAPLWPADEDPAPLVAALRRHAVLRGSLQTEIAIAGASVLDPLPVAARVEVLGLEPALLFAVVPRRGMPAPRWLAGARSLVPLIEAASAVPDRVRPLHAARLLAAIDEPEALTSVDTLVAAIRPAELGDEAPELVRLVEEGRSRSALDWLGCLPKGAGTWQALLAGSPRIQAALWVEPQAFRACVRADDRAALAGLLAAARSRPEAGRSLALRLLGGWSELPKLLDGVDPDEDVLHALLLCGTEAALDAAAGVYEGLVRAVPAERALELIRPSSFRYAVAGEGVPDAVFPLQHAPLVPAAFFARIHSPGVWALAEVALDGPPPVNEEDEWLWRYEPAVAGYGAAVTILNLVAAGRDPAPAPLDLWTGNDGRNVRTVDHDRLALRMMAAGSEAYGRLLCRVLTARPPEGLDPRVLVHWRKVWPRAVEAVRALPKPPAPTPDLAALADSDLSGLAPPLARRFTTEWPDDEAEVPRLLDAARRHLLLRIAAAVVKEARDPGPVLAALGDTWPSRSAVGAALGEVDASTRERVLDRCTDELLPGLFVAAFRALSGGVRWDGGRSAPARLLEGILAEAWCDQPTLVGRALQKGLNDLDGHDPSEAQGVWTRGALFALGKLREPLGGKIPGLLHAFAQDPARAAAVRELAAGQAKLFDHDRMKIQLRYTPAQRVTQAAMSLREAGGRHDGLRVPEVVVRPSRA